MPSILQQLEQLRELYATAHGRKYRRIRFESFDVSSLNPAHNDIHGSLREYLSQCVPNDSICLHEYSLASSEELPELQDAWPMTFLRPHGYLAIGSTDSGNAIAVELTTGKVLICSHERFSEKGIGGWNADCTKWVHVPIRPDTVAKWAEDKYENISKFLGHWIDNVLQQGAH